MKKLLFIASEEIGDQKSGVTAKVLNEFAVFNTHYDTYLVMFEKEKVVVFHSGNKYFLPGNEKKHRMLRIYELENLVEREGICLLYIRYALAFPTLISLLKHTKNSIKKVALEYPDFPYLNRFLKSGRIPHACMDILFRGKLKRYVKKVFACTDQKIIYGMPNERLINGTDTSAYQLRSINECTNDVNIISVSTQNIAHGIDRFIEGLHLYYKNGNSRSIILHLVGEGSEYYNLRQLVKKYKLESKVNFYGAIPNKEQNEIYALCDIGLGAIGFHRINITDDSTLKSREYGLRGMPIIAENKIDIVDESFPYIMYCSKDDCPVDMNKVISFYDLCFKGNKKQKVGEAIRKYFIDRCDINVTMIPVLQYFEANE